VRALVPALALAAVGCADGAGSPSTILTAPRLLAIAADPPVAAPDQVVRLRPLVVDGDGREVAATVSWRACSPWRVVRDPDVDCAPPAAWPLPVADDGAAILDVPALVAAIGQPQVVPPPAGPCEVSAISVPVYAVAEVYGVRLLARKDVRIGGPSRTLPAIAAVLLDGAPATTYVPGEPAAVVVRPARDALDETCTDDPTPLPVLEPVTFHLYATAGTLSESSADVVYLPDGSEAAGSIELTGPDDGGPLRLWAIAVDPDGGVAWTHRDLSAAR
jgi:hypothetical protein